MFKNLFNPDNALMITMSQVTDAIFLSLFWIVGCFPILTVGASSAALYDAAFRAYRKGDKHSWQRFAQVFRRNWKEGILPSLFYLGVFVGMVWLLIQVWNAAVAGTLSWMVFSAAAFVGVLMLGVLSVLFPVLSRFENRFVDLLKNTVFLALANLPRTLAVGFLHAVSMFLCVRYIFPLFFLPALTALLSRLLTEPMFKPYMPEDAPEDAAD